MANAKLNGIDAVNVNKKTELSTITRNNGEHTPKISIDKNRDRFDNFKGKVCKPTNNSTLADIGNYGSEQKSYKMSIQDEIVSMMKELPISAKQMELYNLIKQLANQMSCDKLAVQQYLIPDIFSSLSVLNDGMNDLTTRSNDFATKPSINEIARWIGFNWPDVLLTTLVKRFLKDQHGNDLKNESNFTKYMPFIDNTMQLQPLQTNEITNIEVMDVNAKRIKDEILTDGKSETMPETKNRADEGDIGGVIKEYDNAMMHDTDCERKPKFKNYEDCINNPLGILNDSSGTSTGETNIKRKKVRNKKPKIETASREIVYLKHVRWDVVFTLENLISALSLIGKLPEIPYVSDFDSLLPMRRLLTVKTSNPDAYTTRLHSFLLGFNDKNRTWDNTRFVWPNALVAAGFSYEGEDFIVVCRLCDCRSDTTLWINNDEEYAFKMHREGQRRFCAFLATFYSIPQTLTSEDLVELKYDEENKFDVLHVDVSSVTQAEENNEQFWSQIDQTNNKNNVKQLENVMSIQQECFDNETLDFNDTDTNTPRTNENEINTQFVESEVINSNFAGNVIISVDIQSLENDQNTPIQTNPMNLQTNANLDIESSEMNHKPPINDEIEENRQNVPENQLEQNSNEETEPKAQLNDTYYEENQHDLNNRHNSYDMSQTPEDDSEDLDIMKIIPREKNDDRNR